MPEPTRYSYPRYLTAKRSVDARALNRRVWNEFLDEVSSVSSELRILEVGGGVGATVERIIGALEERPVDSIRYTFVDVTPENIEMARSSLREWAQGRGYEVSGSTEQQWTGGSLDVSVDFIPADLFDVRSDLERASYDAVVAQAVLDLLPLTDALQTLRPLLRDGGLWYLPLHFDGLTAFEPPLDPALDATIERLYHESMSGEKAGREGARSGRALLSQLPAHGAQLRAAGSSDWVVYPRAGDYPDDESYFLHYILHFIATELSGHSRLEEKDFDAWIGRRRRQIEEGQLIYVAHQLDILAKNAAQNV